MISSTTPKNNECVAVLTRRIAARKARPPKRMATMAAMASLVVVEDFNRP